MLANNGILFSEESNKGAHFIQLANARDTPLLFVQNITGFMVGTAAERGGIIKDGAKLINAVSNSAVPHLTLMVGRVLRRGELRDVRAGLRPTVRLHLAQSPDRGHGRHPARRRDVDRSAACRASAPGRPYDEATDARVRRETEEMIEAQSGAVYATGRLWDDGVIDPRHTRTVLGLALSATHSAPVAGADNFAPFRM